MQEVGRRLAELREARGLSQQDLADEMDVTMRYIQSVEHGSQNLTLRSLAGWASILQVPVAELFASPSTRKRRPGRPKRSRE
jgi:transcriptional regulator with XRE-family HTH domain